MPQNARTLYSANVVIVARPPRPMQCMLKQLGRRHDTKRRHARWNHNFWCLLPLVWARYFYCVIHLTFSIPGELKRWPAPSTMAYSWSQTSASSSCWWFKICGSRYCKVDFSHIRCQGRSERLLACISSSCHLTGAAWLKCAYLAWNSLP